jgi:hypothetical protein
VTTLASSAALAPATSAAAAAQPSAVRPLHRSAWPYAGAVAGLVGFIGTAIANGPTPTEAQVDGGVDVVFRALGGPGAVRLGSALGFVATYALILFAAGYVRFLRQRSPDGSLIPRVVQLALTAGVGAMFVGFGLKAAAAGGLAGGIDESFYTHSDAVVINTLAGQMQYVGWQGVAVAMAVTALVALRFRMVPMWVGIVAALFSVFVAVFTLGLGLPYSAGLAGPVFLVVLAVGLLTSRTARRG